MKGFANRRGSALLIVLGMMSFIVVSAVAFSAYMRYARLPSSYLRRVSASRLLAKAALAEAIESIDCAIGNNPYPGVGEKTCKYPRGEDSEGSTQNRNYWRDRIFIGSQQLCGADATVSTLSVEGLAYIPFPFINEARLYSRRSQAGAWQMLPFEAGRYAFCAIDVSDCFDVNRLVAEAARDSSDLGRISLAHCFENTAHTDYEFDPKYWDTFMEEFCDPSGSKVPLVSVADMNLALAANGKVNFVPPFVDYIKNGKPFVENDVATARDELVKNMPFVTDGYFPVTNRNESAIDLSNPKDQPFDGFRMASNDNEKKNDDTADDILNDKTSKFITKYEFPGPEALQLYDYLDRDSVPMSLAMPTVERTPMVTALSLEGEMRIGVNVVKSMVEDPNGQRQFEVTRGNLNFDIQGLSVETTFVYPFKYKHGTRPKFKAQAAATITFVPSGTEKLLRKGNAKVPAIVDRQTWKTSAQNPETGSYGGETIPVVVTMQSAPKDISFGTETILDESDALSNVVSLDLGSKTVDLVGTLPQSEMMGSLTPTDKGTFRKVVMKQKNPTTGTYMTVGEPEWTTDVLQLSNGELSRVQALGDDKYIPVVQVWVRVLDESGNVVDLVPACADDDETKSDCISDYAGAKVRPLLRFYPTDTSTTEIGGAQDWWVDFGNKDIACTPRAYVADDPRFNYAPENLVALADGDAAGDMKNLWYSKQTSQNGDGDIFMTTSDAGYLQSAYELTALLNISGGLSKKSDERALNTGYDGAMRTAFGNAPASASMWRTYSQYNNGTRENDVAPLDIVNGTKGFRINPYTSDPNVLMAALANTPLDWWSASTNFVGDTVKKEWKKEHKASGRTVNDLDKATPYTFSEMSGAQVKVKHGKLNNGVAETGTLLELATKLRDKFRSSTSWETTFDELNWNEEDKIAGVDLGATLHAVDKKFLYGFWRECFANRQQLFLIFVRAEPMMMGGGGLGQTPPQLGARAVALVWRDPTETKEDGGSPRPHRSRVLFYRQFD